MDLEEKWQNALENTRIVRFYRYPLSYKDSTELPYIFLGSSIINEGDTVIRKGKVVVDRPMIVLPQNMPQFSGFSGEDEEPIDTENLRIFLMVRGIRFPSLKYKHEISTLDIMEKEAEKAIEECKRELEAKEDIGTGLIVGNPEHWQLSLLLYVALIINRSFPSDMQRFLGDLP